MDDLVVEYPGAPPVRAVDGVSLTVEPGETVALVGESGSGKSTVARAVAGTIRPHAGSIVYRDEPVPLLGLRRRAPRFTAIQMVFQDPNSSLNPRKRVGAQIADGVAAARTRGQAGSTPAEWLDRVGLSTALASRYPHELSGGQKQRVAIARALASRPSLLIADEPISALDASAQSAVAGLMRSLVGEAGAGMLFISHDLSVVHTITDRVLVMYRGRLKESGPTEEVWNTPRHPYTRALISAIPEPDGAGRLPDAPAVDAPPEWAEELPGALR